LIGEEWIPLPPNGVSFLLALIVVVVVVVVGGSRRRKEATQILE